MVPAKKTAAEKALPVKKAAPKMHRPAVSKYADKEAEIDQALEKIRVRSKQITAKLDNLMARLA